MTGYCDIYDVHDGINSEGGETIRKSGECDVTEVKKKKNKGRQCWILRRAQVKWPPNLEIQKLFVTLPRRFWVLAS